MRATIRRLGVVSAAAAATVAVTATSASAYHCYVPMYSLSAPASSNWFVISAETGADPQGTERIPTPNGADGKGLEYFGAGSTLADEMVETWIAGADAHDCWADRGWRGA